VNAFIGGEIVMKKQKCPAMPLQTESHIDSDTACILIERPEWGDADFCGKWLSAAAHAETLWREARKEPEFDNQVERVCVAFIPDFGIGALVLLRQLLNAYSTTAFVDLDSETGEECVMMVRMGLFVPINERYRMNIPSDLSLSKVKGATLTYAETEDEEYALHPEYLVNTMSFSEARALFEVDAA
jgi:hypothetical protein